MSDPEGSSTPETVAPALRMDISAVSLKIPPFWPADPEVWFAQVEATFTTRGISVQRTKFDHIIASLSPEVATEVRDLILKPPSDNPYDVLREQLIRRTAASEQRKLQQLFTTEQLGDRKPTQLLRRMQQLLGEHTSTTDSAFLRELFLLKLPANVRMVLASTGDTVSLDKLAELADKILEVALPSSIAAVDSSAPQLSTEVSQLREQVTHLHDMVQSFTKRNWTTGRRPKSRSVSPRPPPATATLCWYHQKYGDAARRCKPPCDFALNDQATR